MKLNRFSSQTSFLAALLLSGVLLAGCGQEEEVDNTAAPEEPVQDSQNSETANQTSTQDDQFVAEQASDENDSAMESEAGMESESAMQVESTSGEPVQEAEPSAGDATEEPGFGEGTDPMPGDGEDTSDLSASGSVSASASSDSDDVDLDDVDLSANADSEEENSSNQ